MGKGRAMHDLFVKGGPLMWPLLACSVVSLTAVIDRLFFWFREARRRDASRQARVFRLTEEACFDEALADRGGRPNTVVRVLLAGLADREHGLTEAMAVAASDEIARMKQGMGVLDTIITMAPLLGILGTVTGIIQSFDLLGMTHIADPRGVADGIGQALITTAAGLAIAIATLVPYNYFVSRVQRETRRLEQVTTQFELAYRRGVEHAARKRV